MSQSADLGGEPSKEEIIGKDYARVVALLVAACVCFGASFLQIEALQAHHRLELRLLAAFVIGFLLYDRSLYYCYGVNKEGLTEYCFGKIIRRIPWEDIRQIGIQQDHFIRGDSSRGIIITTTMAPEVPCEQKSGSKAYYRQYRPYVLFVNEYRKSAEVLERYYGRFDY